MLFDLSKENCICPILQSECVNVRLIFREQGSSFHLTRILVWCDDLTGKAEVQPAPDFFFFLRFGHVFFPDCRQHCQRRQCGREGLFAIWFPWRILGDMISRSPKQLINIHWTLSPPSIQTVVKWKSEGQARICGTNTFIQISHTQIAFSK